MTVRLRVFFKQFSIYQRKFSGKLPIYELLGSLTGIVVLAVVVVAVVVLVVVVVAVVVVLVVVVVAVVVLVVVVLVVVGHRPSYGRGTKCVFYCFFRFLLC